MRLSFVMRRWQALISLGLAAVVTLATLGIAPTPAAVRRALGGGGEPYPCEVHACGCTSAEDCFASCCCFSPAELAAWRASEGGQSPAAGAGQRDAEGASDEYEEHCELCLDGASAETVPPAPPVFSLISALTCRAIKLSIVWAPPLLAAPPSFALVEAPAPGSALPARPARAAAAPTGDVPTPPPRA